MFCSGVLHRVWGQTHTHTPTKPYTPGSHFSGSEEPRFFRSLDRRQMSGLCFMIMVVGKPPP